MQRLLKCAVLAALCGCGSSQADLDRTKKANEPSDGRPANEAPASPEANADAAALTSLASLAWSDFASASTAGDASQTQEARKAFVGNRDFGLKHLLGLLEDAGTPPAEKRLALDVLQEIAAAVDDGELRNGAVAVVLAVRDETTAPELRDACTQCMAPLLDLAIEASPAKAPLYYFRGDERLTQKQFDSAIEDFDKAIDIEPGFINAYHLRGIAKRGKGSIAAAVDDFSAALSLNPEYPDVLVLRAATYLDLSRPQDALGDLSTAIVLKPKWAHAYKLRARAYQVLGDAENAKRDLERAEQIRLEAEGKDP